MSPATVEKRARQRANKLKSSTIRQTSPAPPSTCINFETFIDLANLDDVLRFCDAVASTQEGRNLKLLWDRAFEAGLDQGRTEEREWRDEMYLRGKAQGKKEAEEAASSAEIDLYLHGMEKGRTEERTEWTSVGHGPHCLSPIAVLSDQTVQTDLEPITATCDVSIQSADHVDDLVIPPHVEASIQATETLPSPSQPHKTSMAPLDWAEDTNSLPITPLPPSLHQPRDLSVLRSSSSSPFSSLQQRSKRFTRYSHQPRRRHSHFNSNSFYLPHSNSYQPFQPHSHTKTYSQLNWESDPRLSDLSRSLRALGWIRAS
jgi:hypothetical protein